MDAAFYRSSRTGKPPLRIGLLLDTASLPRWSAEVVDHIVQCDFAAIELLVFNGSARKNTGEAPRPRSLMRKVINTLRNARLRRSFLFILYQRWDLRNADPSTDPDTMIDCTERLAHVESMHVVRHYRRRVFGLPVVVRATTDSMLAKKLPTGIPAFLPWESRRSATR